MAVFFMIFMVVKDTNDHVSEWDTLTAYTLAISYDAPRVLLELLQYPQDDFLSS